ncbi:IF140 protein, partial [Polyodon spathula]|nr:IF140 protein [Polyodon spathula]
MAVYFDHHIESPDSAGSPSQITWHSSQPVLAVASISPSTGGSIDLYLQQGEHVGNSHVERPFKPTVLHWHPSKQVLAVGWETGEVLLLSQPDGQQTSLPATHSADISLLDWSSNGSRLLTGDRATPTTWQNCLVTIALPICTPDLWAGLGVLAVWKVDPQGQLQGAPLLRQDYRKHLTHCVFRPAPPGDDLVQLARAAVSGDENALDMFNWRKAGKGGPLKVGPQEGMTFFISTADGSVHYVDEKGKSSQVLLADSPVQKLSYLQRQEVLVVITETLLLSQYSVGPEGSTKELIKVKLSGKSGQSADIAWAEKGLLITATGEKVVRLWDLERDDNYVLSLDEHLGFEMGETLNCVSYCTAKGILAAGTSQGRIAMWLKVALSNEKMEGRGQWKLQTPAELEGNIIQLQWGSSMNLLAVITVSTVLILCEHVMSSHFSQQVAAVQLNPNQLSLSYFSTGTRLSLRTDMHVKGVCVTKDKVTVWNGKQVTVFELSGAILRNTGSFLCESQAVAMHEESIYTVETNRVQVRTLQGTVKQLLVFPEMEGTPQLLSVCNTFLVVGTDAAHIKVFDLSRREAKPHCNAKSLAALIPNLGAITSVKSNANGSQVSVLVTRTDGSVDSKVYFYDVEMDTLDHFDFFTGQSSEGFQGEEPERGRLENSELCGRCPVSQFWDESEPRLFVCETVLTIPASPHTHTTDSTEQADVLVVSFFSTQEHRLLLQESYPRPAGMQALLALSVPYYYFNRKPGEGQVENKGTPGPSFIPQMVSRQALRDFVGLEDCDKPTRDAMLNFSFYLTIRDMDEAFKSIKLIKSSIQTVVMLMRWGDRTGLIPGASIAAVVCADALGRQN